MTFGRPFQEFWGATALVLLLFASALLVPLLGVLAALFAAVPIVWLAARRGAPTALAAAALAAAALLAARVEPPVVLWHAAWQTLPACFVGWRLGRGKGFFASCAAAALAVTALTLGLLLLWSAESGREPFAFFEERMRNAWAALAQAPEAGGTAGVTPISDQEFEQALAIQRRIYPSQLLQAAFLLTALGALTAVRVISRTDPGRVAPPALAAFRLPEHLIWPVIAAVALAWAPGPAGTVALNLALPLLAVYLLQGLSILVSLLARLGTSRLGFSLLTLAFAFQPWLLAAPLLLGLLDFRFDFRTRFAPRPPAT